MTTVVETRRVVESQNEYQFWCFADCVSQYNLSN